MSIVFLTQLRNDGKSQFQVLQRNMKTTFGRVLHNSTLLKCNHDETENKNKQNKTRLLKLFPEIIM